MQRRANTAISPTLGLVQPGTVISQGDVISQCVCVCVLSLCEHDGIQHHKLSGYAVSEEFQPIM